MSTVLVPIEDHRRESGHLGQGMMVPPSSIPSGATHWTLVGVDLVFGRLLAVNVTIGSFHPDMTPSFETRFQILPTLNPEATVSHA
jgi:hypothetical protein